MDQEFFITLPSNVKSYTENDVNTMSTYKTYLKKKINFPKEEKWRVGIAEISYSKSWFNVRQKSLISFFNENGVIQSISASKPNTDDIFNTLHKIDDFELIISGKTQGIDQNVTYTQIISAKPGYYHSVKSLIDQLNILLGTFHAYVDNIPFLDYDNVNHIVKLHAGESELIDGGTFYPDFGEEVNNILGFVDEKGRCLLDYTTSNDLIEEIERQNAFNHGILRGKRCAEINAGLQSIFVYSNIVEHNLVGDELAQLLRIVEVPPEKTYGDFVTIHYDKPHFMPLQTNSFDSILLELRDDTSDLIPFQFGRVNVKLIFRKYE